MLKHKGGSLDVWDSTGKKVETLHYGPGLDRACKECFQPKNKPCITKSGAKLGKSHKSRLTN